MPQIEGDMRLRVAEFLPDALNAALLSYQTFSETQATDPKDPKASEFKAHHDACKVALAHIQLLLKLAEMADVPDPDAEHEAHYEAMHKAMARAYQELEGIGE